MVTDRVKLYHLRHTVSRHNGGIASHLATEWYVNLTRENIRKLEQEPYVVTARPSGVRYLLYVDPSEEIFMQNISVHFFRLDEDRKLQLNTVGETLLDGYIMSWSGDWEGKRLTYLVKDCTLCNGVDLKQRGLLERIRVFKVLKFV